MAADPALGGETAGVQGEARVLDAQVREVRALGHAAIYRKAGVESRAQLPSHFVEDLMAGVVLDGPASGRTPQPAPPAEAAARRS